MTNPPISVRKASPEDVALVAGLIQELAETAGERSPISPGYVVEYLAFPGNSIYLAQRGEQVVGLLSCSVRPNLYHAGNTCMIEELVVGAGARGEGVGSALLATLFDHLENTRCVEVSVSVKPDNLRAQKFYRRHGLVDEAVYLEKHLIERE